MGELVRVGFIGCGGNARGHMGRVKDLEFAEVTAVCDTVEALAHKASLDYGGRSYTDLDKMLDEAGIDCVVISIPVFAHGGPERAALARNIPFLVEKPVSREMDTAREIEELVRKQELITAVGYQLRYSVTSTRARALLTNEPIGLAVGSYWCGTGRMDPSRWTVQMARSGGQIHEQATHTIDMIRYLAGEIDEVFCYSGKQILHEIDCPDANVVSWQHSNGALGTLTTSWAMDPSDWRFANQVHITGDALHLHWSAPKLLVKRGSNDVEEVTGGGPSIDEAFCRAVQTGDPSGILSPYSDGLKTMAISLAALKSAETGQPVKPSEL